MSELVIRGLRGGYTPDIDVLNGIDLSLEKQEVVGIIGLNGCGKSTLAKAVVNIIPRRTGTVYLKGLDISALSTREIARKGLRLMQQGGVVFKNLSVLDNLGIAMGNADEDLFRCLKENIPLLRRPEKELSRLKADRLSGGQRHQLALALTLAQKPDVVILDEPSAGLSPVAVNEMYSLMSVLKKEFALTAMVIEQNIDKAIEFCDRCVFLSQGTIAEEFRGEDKEAIRTKIINRIGL